MTMQHFSRLKKPARSPHALTLELDDPSGVVRAGDTIRGRLHVVAGHGPPPRSLAVELQVAGHGEVSAVGVAAEVAIPVEPWAPGQRATHPFSIVAPPLPPPFSGQLFRSEARLAAVLEESDDPPGPLKPVARAFPASATPVSILAVGPVVAGVRRDSARTVRLGSAGGVVMGAVLLGGGLATIALGALLAAVFDVAFVACATLGLVGALFGFLGGYLFFSTFGNWRAERSLGVPKVTIEPVPGEQGGMLGVSVTVAPGARVLGGRARLRIHESIQIPATGHDADGWGRDQEVFVEDYALAAVEPGRYAVGIRAVDLDRLPLPLELVGDYIHWTLELTVDLRGGKKWKTSAMLDAFRGERWRPRGVFSFVGG
jgi:hypothetical protein